MFSLVIHAILTIKMNPANLYRSSVTSTGAATDTTDTDVKEIMIIIERSVEF